MRQLPNSLPQILTFKPWVKKAPSMVNTQALSVLVEAQVDMRHSLLQAP